MVHPDLGTLQDAAHYAETVADQGIDTSNAMALTKMRNALISLEKVAEEARKEVIEPALDDEIDVGDRVANLQRVRSEQPSVTDTTAALKMLEDAGADPEEVVRVNPKQFVDAVNGSGINPSMVIDYTEYTYYRQDDK